jgi:sec-independent protein translocase protein TatB
MFDVGLTELMVIGVVALIVIGPERLPKVARTAGLLLGRLQRYVGDVKADINREIQLDELKKMQQEVTTQVGSISASVTHEMREIEKTIDPLADSASAAAAASAPTGPTALDAAAAPGVVPAPGFAVPPVAENKT